MTDDLAVVNDESLKHLPPEGEAVTRKKDLSSKIQELSTWSKCKHGHTLMTHSLLMTLVPSDLCGCECLLSTLVKLFYYLNNIY